MKIIINAFIIISAFEWKRTEGCGIPNGTLVCDMGTEDFQPFRPTLCTHAAFSVYLDCKNDVCTPKETAATRGNLISYLEPNIPIGIHLSVELDNEDFLKQKSRRNNTVTAIIKFMEDKKMTFAQFAEYSWHRDFKNTTRRAYLDLIEELAVPFRARKWKVGMLIQTDWEQFCAIYDFKELSTFVDWFIIGVEQKERIENGKLFVTSAYPLVYENNSPGSFKYWAEYTLKKIKPECVLFSIDLRAKKYTAKEGNLDPGPGSEVEPWFSRISYKQLCQKIIDENCSDNWDPLSSTPFAACGKDYFTYESPRSISLKVKLLKSYNITGAFVWAYLDDDQGLCTRGTFPNLKATQEFRQA